MIGNRLPVGPRGGSAGSPTSGPGPASSALSTVRGRTTLIDRGLSEHRLGMAPTPRQLEVLGEVIVHGNCGEAASCLRLSIHTVKKHVDYLYARIGASGYRQATYLLGWTQIPDGIVREHGAAR